MKGKKLLSAFAALAMTVSAFAGLAVTANAATEIYSADYASEATGWSGSTSHTIVDGYVQQKGSGTGNRSGHAVATNKLESGVGLIKFDFMVSNNTGTASRSVSQIAISTGDEKDNTNTTVPVENRIFALTSPTYSTSKHDGVYYINDDTDNTVTISYSQWYTISAYVDLANHNVKVKVLNQNNNTVLYEGTTSFSESIVKAGAIYSLWPRGSSGYHAFDNFSISQLVSPSFNLGSTEVTPSVAGETTVDITDITGDITVSSSDETVATAEYSNDKIAIKGVSAGVATVTVTALNDGLTLKKEISVIVGDVQTANVTVNFYKTGTTESVKDQVTLTNRTVGLTITADDIDISDFTTDTAKYKYNTVSSTALPYTVLGTDNVINIYYDEAAAVKTVTFNYMFNNNKVATRTVPVTGYVGDVQEIVDVFYITGTDGTVYKTGEELYTSNANNTNTAATTSYNRNVTLGSDYAVNVTLAEKAEYFVEGEDLGVDSSIPDSNRKSNLTCSGDAASGVGNKNSSVDVYTVKESGQYQIVVVSYARNRNSLLMAGENELAKIGNSNNNYRGLYTVVTTNLNAGEKITYKANGEVVLTEIDYILIRKLKSIEVLDNAVKEATLTNQEVTPADGGASITVNGTAYTVWYKLNNFAEGTQPTITLRNGDSTFNETATITQAEAGDNGYYCVQILGEGLAVGSYTITLTADGVSKEVTFTVAEGIEIPDAEI